MYLGQTRVTLIGISILSIILLTGGFASQSNAEGTNPVTFKGGQMFVTFNGCTDTNPAVCTWTVTNDSNKNAISHTVIGGDSCLEYLTATNPPTVLTQAVDPTTQVFGIKWDGGPSKPDSQDLQMEFTLGEGVLLIDDETGPEEYRMGIKAGKFAGSGIGVGPLCIQPEIEITKPLTSVKWGETASVSGTAANFDPATSTITIDWGDDTEDTIIDPAATSWGPVTHEYASSQSGLSPTVTATLNLNPGSISDTASIDVTIHTTSLDEPDVPTSIKWGHTYKVSNTLTDLDADVCTAVPADCPSSIMGEDITYTGTAVESTTAHTSTVSLQDLDAPKDVGNGKTVNADFAGNAAYTPSSNSSFTVLLEHDTSIQEMAIEAGQTERPVTVTAVLVDDDNDFTGISLQPIVFSGDGAGPPYVDAIPSVDTGGVFIRDSTNGGIDVGPCVGCSVEGDGLTPYNAVLLKVGDEIIFEQTVATAHLWVESPDLLIEAHIDDRTPDVYETGLGAGIALPFAPNVSTITIDSISTDDDPGTPVDSFNLIRVIGFSDSGSIIILNEAVTGVPTGNYEEIAVGGGSFGVTVNALEEPNHDLPITASFNSDLSNIFYNPSQATVDYDLDLSLDGDVVLGTGALATVTPDSGISIGNILCGADAVDDTDGDDICKSWEDIDAIKFKQGGDTWQLNLPGMDDGTPTIMLELDWMEDHYPNATAIQQVIDVFDTEGQVDLVVFYSDEVTHVDTLNVWTDMDNDEENDFNSIKSNFYGNSTFRTNIDGQTTAIDQATLADFVYTSTLEVSDSVLTTPAPNPVITLASDGVTETGKTKGIATIKAKITTEHFVSLSVPPNPDKPSPGSGIAKIAGKVTASILPIPGFEHIVTIKIPFLVNTARTGDALTDHLGLTEVLITYSGDPGTVSALTYTNSPGVISEAIEAYSQVVRYGLFGHSMGGASGTSEFLGNDLLVMLGEGFGEVDDTHTGSEGTGPEQSGTLLHELGHQLGLRHGGPQFVGDTAVEDADENCKPNYRSVMSYTRQTPVYLGADWELNFSHGNMKSLQESHLNEINGFESLFGPAGDVPYMRSDGLAKTPKLWITGVDPIDNVNFQKNTMKFEDDVAVDINNFGIPGCNTASTSDEEYHDHDDWDNLVFNFRGNADSYFDGSTFSNSKPISETSDDFIDFGELLSFTLNDPIMDSPPNDESTVKKGSKVPTKISVKYADGDTPILRAAVHGHWVNDSGVTGFVEDKFGKKWLKSDDNNSGFHSINFQVPRQAPQTIWVTMYVGEKEFVIVDEDHDHEGAAYLHMPAVEEECPSFLLIPPEKEQCATFKLNVTK